jgi:hypothetical protein
LPVILDSSFLAYWGIFADRVWKTVWSGASATEALMQEMNPSSRGMSDGGLWMGFFCLQGIWGYLTISETLTTEIPSCLR